MKRKTKLLLFVLLPATLLVLALATGAAFWLSSKENEVQLNSKGNKSNVVIPQGFLLYERGKLSFLYPEEGTTVKHNRKGEIVKYDYSDNLFVVKLVEEVVSPKSYFREQRKLIKEEYTDVTEEDMYTEEISGKLLYIKEFNGFTKDTDKAVRLLCFFEAYSNAYISYLLVENCGDEIDYEGIISTSKIISVYVTPTPTNTPTPTPTNTPTPTPTNTPTPTPTNTPTPTPTNTPTPIPTATSTPIATPTMTPLPGDNGGTESDPSKWRFEAYSDKYISLQIPAGWEVFSTVIDDGNGTLRLLYCLRDPVDTENLCFYVSAAEPLFANAEAKNTWVPLMNTAMGTELFNVAPVLPEMNARGCINEWSAVYSLAAEMSGNIAFLFSNYQVKNHLNLVTYLDRMESYKNTKAYHVASKAVARVTVPGDTRNFIFVLENTLQRQTREYRVLFMVADPDYYIAGDNYGVCLCETRYSEKLEKILLKNLKEADLSGFIKYKESFY